MSLPLLLSLPSTSTRTSTPASPLASPLASAPALPHTPRHIEGKERDDEWYARKEAERNARDAFFRLWMAKRVDEPRVLGALHLLDADPRLYQHTLVLYECLEARGWMYIDNHNTGRGLKPLLGVTLFCYCSATMPMTQHKRGGPPTHGGHDMAWVSYAASKRASRHGGNPLYYEPFDNYVHLNMSSTGGAELEGQEFDQRSRRVCTFRATSVHLQRMVQLSASEFRGVMEHQKATRFGRAPGASPKRKKTSPGGSTDIASSDGPSSDDMKVVKDRLEDPENATGEPKYDFTVAKPAWTVPFMARDPSRVKTSQAEEEAILRHLCCSWAHPASSSSSVSVVRPHQCWVDRCAERSDRSDACCALLARLAAGGTDHYTAKLVHLLCSKLRTKLRTAPSGDTAAASALADMVADAEQHMHAFRSFDEATLRLLPEDSFLTVFDQLRGSLAWQVGPAPLRTILGFYVVKSDDEQERGEGVDSEERKPYRATCVDSKLESLEQKTYSTTWIQHYLWGVYNTTTALDPMDSHWLRTSSGLRTALDIWATCLLALFQGAEPDARTVHVGLRAMILASCH